MNGIQMSIGGGNLKNSECQFAARAMKGRMISTVGLKYTVPQAKRQSVETLSL
jgi:hypothetical protein